MGNMCNGQSNSNQIQFMDHSKGDYQLLQKNKADKPSSSFATLSKQPILSQLVSSKLRDLKNSSSIKQELRGSPLPCHQIKGQGMFYKGEWQKGRPHGKGMIIFAGSGACFQGGFRQGKAHCQDGIFVYPDGSYYRGNIKGNEIQGKGTFQYALNGLIYNGEWKGNRPHGKGKQTFRDGSVYVGNFLNGRKEGQGKFSWSDGRQYDGSFADGCMHGYGKLRDKNGKGQFIGTFDRNLKQDGKLKTEYGEYFGKFKNGQMDDSSGQFKFYDDKIYRGGFKNGKFHGAGQIFYPNGQVANGTWEDGENIIIDNIKRQK